MGCAATTFLSAASYLALWINFLLLLCLKFAATFFTAWWIKVPLVLVVVAAWVFLMLLAAAGKAHGEDLFHSPPVFICIFHFIIHSSHALDEEALHRGSIRAHAVGVSSHTQSIIGGETRVLKTVEKTLSS